MTKEQILKKINYCLKEIRNQIENNLEKLYILSNIAEWQQFFIDDVYEEEEFKNKEILEKYFKNVKIDDMSHIKQIEEAYVIENRFHLIKWDNNHYGGAFEIQDKKHKNWCISSIKLNNLIKYMKFTIEKDNKQENKNNCCYLCGKEHKKGDDVLIKEVLIEESLNKNNIIGWTETRIYCIDCSKKIKKVN